MNTRPGLGVAAGIAILLMGAGSASGQVINACVSSVGAIRILVGVPFLDACNPFTEKAISWNLTDLTKALSDEIAARKAADAALQGSILDLQVQLFSAELALSQKITDEQNARAAGDQQLRNLIGAQGRTFTAPALATFLPNGDDTVLAMLSLPAGNYFVIGKTNVFNAENSALWGCKLLVNGSLVDEGIIQTESTGLSMHASGGVVVMQKVVTLGAPGQIKMTCHSGEPKSDVDGIELIAIQVGTVN